MTYSEMAAQLADARRDATGEIGEALALAIAALERVAALTAPPPPEGAE